MTLAQLQGERVDGGQQRQVKLEQTRVKWIRTPGSMIHAICAVAMLLNIQFSKLQMLPRIRWTHVCHANAHPYLRQLAAHCHENDPAPEPQNKNSVKYLGNNEAFKV